MHGYIYCISNRDREGEYILGFTEEHVRNVLLELDATGHAKPLRLELIKATLRGAGVLEAIVTLLSRLGRRLASSPDAYVFDNISKTIVQEVFAVADGEVKQSMREMGDTFEDGQIVMHKLNDIKERTTPEGTVVPHRAGGSLCATYCADTMLLVCSDFPGGPRMFTSICAFASANCALLGRKWSLNGWDYCMSRAPDGSWIDVQSIRGRFAPSKSDSA